MPHFGNPQIGVVSLITVISILFGTLIGVKLSLVIYYCIGFISFYYLARYLKFNRLSAILSAIIYCYSGIISSALGVGMIAFLPYFCSPLIILFYLKSINSFKYLFYTPLLLALTFYQSYQITIVFIPFFLILALCLSIFFRNKRYIFNIVFILLGLILISSPKLILYYELLHNYPRKIIDFSGYTFISLYKYLVSPNQKYHLPSFDSIGYANDENSLYFGFASLILIIVSFFYYFRSKHKNPILSAILIASIINLWLMFGSNVFISLWNLLKKVPFYDSFRVAQRFRFNFPFLIAIFSAYGFNLAFSKRLKKLNFFKYLLVLLVYIQLCLFSYLNFWQYSFIIKTTNNVSKTKIIKQTDVDLISTEHSVDLLGDLKKKNIYLPWSQEFFAIQNNYGTINCYESIPVFISVYAYNNPEYLGEFYTYSNNKSIRPEFWSPNKIEFTLNAKAQDKLIVNQNYDSNWYVSVNSITAISKNYKGLLSIKLHRGYNNVVFSYKPYQKYLNGFNTFISAGH